MLAWQLPTFPKEKVKYELCPHLLPREKGNKGDGHKGGTGARRVTQNHQRSEETRFIIMIIIMIIKIIMFIIIIIILQSK